MSDDVYAINKEEKTTADELKGARGAVDVAVERLSNLYIDETGQQEVVWSRQDDHFRWCRKLEKEPKAAIEDYSEPPNYGRRGADTKFRNSVPDNLGALMDEFGTDDEYGWRKMRANMQWRMRHAYKHGALDGFFFGLKYAIEHRPPLTVPLSDEQKARALAALFAELRRLGNLSQDDRAHDRVTVAALGFARDQSFAMFGGDSMEAILNKHDSY